MSGTRKQISPQPGFQQKFAQCSSDILIGGGRAGVGKSWSLLTEPLYHYMNPEFGAVYFRRTTPEISAEGALWDEANKLYGSTVGGTGSDYNHTWKFPHPQFPTHPKISGAKIRFTHLEYEKDAQRHKGAQYPLINFDELTSFSRSQFWFLLSRNRSMCGVEPYLRATTNPQSDGWVKSLLGWWLYPDDHDEEHLQGYPIPEREGVERFLFKEGDTILWGDTREDLKHRVLDVYGGSLPTEVEVDRLIKSMTFLGGDIMDNKELLRTNPTYLANLQSLPEEERVLQFLGCWKYLPGRDQLFDRSNLLDCFDSTWITGGKSLRERYITADIAMEGADKFVIMVWDGWKVIHLEVIDKSDGSQVLGKLRELSRRFKVPTSQICYDGDGVGSYLRGFLSSAYSFQGGSGPIPMRVRGKSKPVKPNYENLRTQCYHLLAGMTKNIKLHLPQDVFLPQIKNMVIQELMAHKKRDPGPSGKIRISRKAEVKEIIGRSPDFSDCLMMRMIFALTTPQRSSSTAI